MKRKVSNFFNQTEVFPQTEMWKKTKNIEMWKIIFYFFYCGGLSDCNRSLNYGLQYPKRMEE